MPHIKMRRNGYSPTGPCEHAGLFLLKGFEKWPLSENSDEEPDSVSHHNKDIATHHKRAADIPPPGLYRQAYRRWKAHLIEQNGNCQHWFGELTGRLYLGMGEASPLEAGITLHHTYGVPFIPGSAIKGVLHHYAIDGNMDEGDMKTIFGEEPDPGNRKSGAAGHVIFNDAWWIPDNTKPLTPEVITVHHPGYYASEGTEPATDFDDPNPNPQIAIRGSFHFSFLADPSLQPVVLKLLAEALQHQGIGGKTSSGYGLFQEDTSSKYEFDRALAEHVEKSLQEGMSPLERQIHELENTAGNNPAVSLLQALEANTWPDSKDRRTVALRIKEIMVSEGNWIPDFTGTNKQKLKRMERCQKVMGYLPDKEY